MPVPSFFVTLINHLTTIKNTNQMKKVLLIFIATFLSVSIYSQDITGQWNGLLKVQGVQLRLVFNITKIEMAYSATMDSPDQGAKGIPVQTTSFENSIVKLELPNLMIAYEGTLEGNTIKGNFNQGGMSLPLDLVREEQEKEVLVRPQEPKEPYPYYSEEVKFKNTKDGIVLAGALTLPEKEGRFPAVILISGSGPQNRNEELLGHKPFLVLADHLTKKGIAVLRFDDRGTAESEGDFKAATSFDFAQDVEAALLYLQTRKEINKKKIGLIGHSEGGIIAPMLAAKSKQVDFIVLMAGTGISGDKLLLAQQELIGRASGLNEEALENIKASNKGAFDIISGSDNLEMIKADLKAYLKQAIKESGASAIPEGTTEDELVSRQIEQLTSPWMLNFLKYDPAPALEKVKCPVLAINGSKDLQVPAEINLGEIEKALKKGKNKRFEIKELPNLNHLFQECETGAPSEYATIEQTISPSALTAITDWIVKQVN